MTEWEHLRSIVTDHADCLLADRIVDQKDIKRVEAERDRALAFIDKLEAAVTLTQKWINDKNYIPYKRNGQLIDREKVIVNIRSETRAVFDAIKGVQP